MIPVDQDRFGPVEGNCFSACVASVLELPLAEVPFFMTSKDWWPPFIEWCARRDLYPVYMKDGRAPLGYAIVGGPVERYGGRDDVHHACVALDGKIVHDPNPCRAGLSVIHDYIVFVPLAPTGGGTP